MKQKHLVAIGLLGLYLLLFLPFLGQVHLFDWDEINFAEAAREMLVTGDWLNVQINYEPFWEKPPLFIWMQAVSMKLFGISAFAARLPNVLIGFITLLFLYYVAFRHYGQKAAILVVLLYIGSFTPHLYFKTGIIDPLYNLLIILSVYALVRSVQTRLGKYYFYAGLFLGLSFMAKGPASLLLVGLTGLAYQLIYRDHFYTLSKLLVLLTGLISIPGLWMVAQVAGNGWWFISEFFNYQFELFSQPVASHGQPFYYHPAVLLIGCFPLMIFALRSLGRSQDNDPLARWMKLLFWVVLIVFSTVTTKIVHYSSLTYIPLALLACKWMISDYRLHLVQKGLILLVGALWSIALFFIVHLGRNADFKSQVMSLIKDDFVLAQLSTEVQWSGFHYILPIALLLLIVYILIRPQLVNAVSFLLFNALFFTVLLLQFVPRIEAYTQKDWVSHLQQYSGQNMVHFTQGFKSYAHFFYTEVQQSQEVEAIKREVLQDMGKADFYSLDQHEKKRFDAQFRSKIIHATNLPFSLSAKLDKVSELNKDSKLTKVFTGNGYTVWERKRD